MMTQVGLKDWWGNLREMGFQEFAESEQRAN
jgi:hypothetical protein